MINDKWFEYLARAFWLVTAPAGGVERGGTKSPPPPPPHHNFFVIGRIMMKLGKLVKCYKLYLFIGFWWVNWLWRHNDVIINSVSVKLNYLSLECSFPNIELHIEFNYVFEALNLYYTIVQHKGYDHVVMTSQKIGFCLRAL